MARHKLTVPEVKAASKPGKLGDGDGLYLHVSKSSTKSWVFIWVRNGKRREMGLGSFGAGTGQVSLSAAREKADEVRRILGRGGDPFSEMEERKAAVEVVTFAECVDELLKSMEGTWKNSKHRAQWEMTLGDTYCARIRKLSVADVSTDNVVAVLEPIWKTKNETAARLRGRIERVLDYARVEGYRTGENPARWKGHLEHRFGKREKLTKRGHHAALPYAEVPEFFQRLRNTEGLGARGLELLILTAARTGEIIGAKWNEFDFVEKVWLVPADRMKAGREHRVPLTDEALAVLEVMREQKINDYVFPGRKENSAISDMTMAKTLKTMKVPVTVHGFRSSFRDWTSEATSFPSEIAEAALAHLVGDEVERAYRRGDVLQKRRKLMQAWAGFLTIQKAGSVVSLHRKA
ncbi:tyrosine-type recombinase/integrase [Neorhizobium sp. DAR64860/K0K1]|uniref:tyrosine-type recombinase/integrase n=1 Tax=Neorhizobium sp. DAR64860/K0K1 TaxID=3421955 RepID=UPI003D290B14